MAYTQQQPGSIPGYIQPQYEPKAGYIQQGPTLVSPSQQPGTNPGYIQRELGPTPGYTPQYPGPVYSGYPQQNIGPVYPIQHSKQPVPNPGMLVGGGNRNVKNRPVGPEGREWSYSLFGCQLGTCLLAWCLPCIVYGQVKRRYDHLNIGGFPDPEHGGVVNQECAGYAVVNMFTGCSWILQMDIRKRIRERYNIRGGGCTDCLTAFWCAPCDLTQTSRELELEERSFGNQGPIMNVG